jgi:hypothetical protein
VSEYGIGLFDQHAELLRASAITPEVARARGYVSVDTATTLGKLSPTPFAKAQRVVPGLLIPIHGPGGDVVLHQYRPDVPRLDVHGRARKYETPYKAKLRLDVPPIVREQLADTSVELYVTEGARKVDAAVSAGLCCIGTLGVDGWSGEQALRDWHSVALKGRRVVIVFDSDTSTKPGVQRALRRIGEFLDSRGATVAIVDLPAGDGGAKIGLDDWLAAGHDPPELEGLIRVDDDVDTPSGTRTAVPRLREPPRFRDPVLDAIGVHDAVDVFCRWLALDHPPLELYATLGAYAANMLDGDPVWLMLIGGSGSGKTELLMSLRALDRVVFRSTLSGEAALLSGTAKKERAKDSTGGLLHEIGEHGVLVLKDFTSILSMNRDTRAILLAALRETFDGSWSRQVGTDGGRTLTWKGKLGLVAGCTTAFDGAHAVQAVMGERFTLCRRPDKSATHDDRQALAALAQSGRENGMRAELTEAVRTLFADGLPRAPDELAPADERRLVHLGQLAVAARSPVERGYHGEVALIGDAEAPTRFVKSLERLWAGLSTIGLERSRGWEVVAKVALDSIPKLRRAVLDALSEGDERDTTTIAGAVKHPTTTTRRALEELHAHGLLSRQSGGPGKADRWRLASWAHDRYRLVFSPTDISGVPPSTSAPEMSVPPNCPTCGGPMKADDYCPTCEPELI